jgi:[acyl-carrier-protein] S-malonyltransferase
MGLGLIFAGQGGQHPDMLPWIDGRAEAAPALRGLAAALGPDWRDRCRDTAWIQRNEVAQTLLTGVSLAAWQCVKPLLPRPHAMAGYSVGELAAFSAAGVFDTHTAFQLASQRAPLMSACAQGVDTGLMSVGGLMLAPIEAICHDHALQIAIHTGPDTFIVGGLAQDLAEAGESGGGAGGRCERLTVPLASHTHWMDGAAAAFAEQLAVQPFSTPGTPLTCNFSGQLVRDPEALRTALSGQLAAPVLWSRCMDTLAERGVRCVLEIGPGAMLARIWNARFPQIPARSLDEFRDPAKAAAWCHKTLAAG